MKILHFAPQLQIGGATQLAADLVYALQAYEVQSLLLRPPCEQVAPLAGAQLRQFVYRPYPLLGRIGSVIKLRRMIRTHAPKIVQTYGYEAAATAVHACKGLPEGSRPRIVAALLGYPTAQERRLLPLLGSCDAITMISKHLRTELKKAVSTLIKSWVIPYGVNETLCYPGYTPSAETRAEWQQRHPELKDRFVICLPGPISAAHGTAGIIPIMTSLLSQDIPAHMLIAGNTKAAIPAFLNTLHRQLRSAGLEQRVTWLGAPPNMRDVYCMSDAVLSLNKLPAAYDRPILEALALGRPVAGYDHGVIGEYLGTFNPIGALPPGDEDAAADVLSQWYSYPPEPDSGVSYPYRLSDTAANYYELYLTLIGS